MLQDSLKVKRELCSSVQHESERSQDRSSCNWTSLQLLKFFDYRVGYGSTKQ